LDGNGGVDAVYGDGASDLVSGGSGRNYLYGVAGDDRLRGGGRFNRLSGGPGNDRMNRGPFSHDNFLPGARRLRQPRKGARAATPQPGRLLALRAAGI